ncbi:MAG: long-chain fatty acid--CoA ligase [Isosphaeraceae bacterium]|nr:long-chain fatty acid--CoA ligase [Isosphaeraceae bacterium]
MAYSNLATMHRSVAEQLGPRAALRYKRYGLYHTISWDIYRRRADAAAAALIDFGIQPGDRIGLLSENRPEWLIADIAILSAGAVDVPIHAPSSPKQVEYQLGHSESRVVFVSNQAQADKVRSVLESLPRLEFLVSFEPVDVGGAIRHVTWEGLLQRGRMLGPQGQAEVRRREEALTLDDLATIIYTSGTTGLPKGVMLTHGNLLSNAATTVEISKSHTEDVILSYLPYSHIYARACDHYMAIYAGSTLCLAESIDTLVANLAEIQPTVLSSVPRFYEKVWASIEHLPPEARAKALRGILGSRVRHFSSGGAPLPRHVALGFMEAGLPLMEGYGLTESSPVISFNHPGAFKVGSVGRPIPGVEVKIAADGEILTRGPHVMKGYWKDPEATVEAIRDGWLHTGDVGYLDEDGFLFITDRKKDLIITSGGKNIAPSELERLLASDPYIDQAVVYGDGKPCPSALIVPNLPALEAKAAELGCRIELDDRDLIRTQALYDFMAERIDRLMQAVSNPERVKAFLMLGRPLKLDAEELTATLKVRRKHILSKFVDRLDALYQEK